MKITLKSLICMSLTVLLLISTVACASPVEPAMGNDAKIEGTTDVITEEPIQAETVPIDPNTDFYARYRQSENLQGLTNRGGNGYSYNGQYYFYEPANRYYGQTSGRMVEVAPNVYMGIYDWEFLQEIQTSHADETLIFRFSVFPGDVVDSYFLNENTAETVAQKIRDDEEESATIERATQITDEEFLSIVKAFQYILDENAICYYREDGLPYVYYRDRAYHKYSVTCCMTIEEILSLNIPEGEYITISFYGKCK